MAVESVEPGQRRAGSLGHAQPVAERGAGMALQDTLRAGADMKPEQLRIAWKTAIGDHDGGCREGQIGAGSRGRDPGAASALDAQRRRPRPEVNPALAL